jgi:hypothetical protein
VSTEVTAAHAANADAAHDDAVVGPKGPVRHDVGQRQAHAGHGSAFGRPAQEITSAELAGHRTPPDNHREVEEA